MASFIAKHTFNQFKKKLNPSTILKNHDTGDADRLASDAGGIQWDHINYPRFIHVCHYDLSTDPIPNSCKKVIRHVYNTSHLIQFLLVFNLITNISLVSAGVDSSADHILFSVLHLMIGTPLIQYTWFTGYKGLAGELLKKKRIFYVLWLVCCVIMILYIIIASGNVHGYTGINPSQQSAYIGIAATESTLWLIVLIVSLYVVYEYIQYQGHTLNRSKESHSSLHNNKSDVHLQINQPVVQINKYSLEADAAASGRHISKKTKERHFHKSDGRASN